MRRILLWMAGNRWLKERLPRLRFTRRAVRRFMPGEDLESALDAGARYQADGISLLFTHLGENVIAIADADQVAEHYLGVLAAIKERGLDGEISVKPTQLGLDLGDARGTTCRTLDPDRPGDP